MWSTVSFVATRPPGYAPLMVGNALSHHAQMWAAVVSEEGSTAAISTCGSVAWLCVIFAHGNVCESSKS